MEMVDFGQSHELEVLIEKMALAHNDLIDVGIADPDHPEKSAVRHPAFHGLHAEPMMHRIEVTREVAFNDPASRGALDGIRERQFDGADRVMQTAARTKPVGHPAKVTLPDGVHGH